MSNENSSLSFGLPDYSDYIAKELSADESTGIISITRRGLGRLCGVEYQSWGQNGSVFTKKIDEFITEEGIERDSFVDEYDRIPDSVAPLVVKYYAYEKRPQARKVDKAFGSVGFRTIGQKITGWKKPVTPTKQQIIELLVLPVPSAWEPRFSDDFYKEMSRLTNLKASGHLRPQLWGRLTAEWVYNYLPTGVYQEVKAWQLATDPTNKLHQYLSPEGIEVLKKQLTLVSNIMQSAGHWREVSQLVDQAATKTYQCSIFYSTKTR